MWFKTLCRLYKGKNIFPIRAMKAYGIVELKLHSFLISAIDTSKWLAYGTNSFTRTGKASNATE
jgi:hypothetical protein